MEDTSNQSTTIGEGESEDIRGSTQTVTSQKNRKRTSQRTSLIWGHFTPVEGIEDARASCNYCDGGEILKSQFAKHLEEEQSLEDKSEVVKFLSESLETMVEGFDILAWWKTNSPRFPILSQLARDVLAIPVSTVASESAFSTSGRILDPFRSSLSPMMVEALVCAQNWLRSSSVIDLRHAMDEVEKYANIENELEKENSPIVVMDSTPVTL